MSENYQFDPNGAFRAQREVPDEVAAVEPETDVISDDAFSYDGYQVVRGEFFAHTFEPSITFNNCKVSVNSACVNKLPDVDYVQILVNPTQKKLAVRPCGEDEKDSFACLMVKWHLLALKSSSINELSLNNETSVNLL